MEDKKDEKPPDVLRIFTSIDLVMFPGIERVVYFDLSDTVVQKQIAFFRNKNLICVVPELLEIPKDAPGFMGCECQILHKTEGEDRGYFRVNILGKRRCVLDATETQIKKLQIPKNPKVGLISEKKLLLKKYLRDNPNRLNGLDYIKNILKLFLFWFDSSATEEDKECLAESLLYALAKSKNSEDLLNTDAGQLADMIMGVFVKHFWGEPFVEAWSYQNQIEVLYDTDPASRLEKVLSCCQKFFEIYKAIKENRREEIGGIGGVTMGKKSGDSGLVELKILTNMGIVIFPHVLNVVQVLYDKEIHRAITEKRLTECGVVGWAPFDDGHANSSETKLAVNAAGVRALILPQHIAIVNIQNIKCMMVPVFGRERFVVEEVLPAKSRKGLESLPSAKVRFVENKEIIFEDWLLRPGNTKKNFIFDHLQKVFKFFLSWAEVAKKRTGIQWKKESPEGTLVFWARAGEKENREDLLKTDMGYLADLLMGILIKYFSFSTAAWDFETQLMIFTEPDSAVRLEAVLECWAEFLKANDTQHGRNLPARVDQKSCSAPGNEGKQGENTSTYEKRFEKIKNQLRDPSGQQTIKEIERAIRLMKEQASNSPNYEINKTWLDTVLDLYELGSTEECVDIEKIRKVLDDDHFGLEHVKERILEGIAVRILKQKQGGANKGSILCFVGPPGVGKTSLGQSIARALGRKFFRMSVGGVHEESEIRGHRRTFIGAMPGQIIKGMRNVGSKNPLFMIDEIDKLGKGFRGDPSSAMLEVLDPEQNRTFKDHYLDCPFDLSQVFFIATANVVDTIPPALRDRMEIIRLPGYTEKEKIGIAKAHLVPKQLEISGLDKEILPVVFSEEAISRIIREYTRESGVRNLEREIGAICRKLARRVVGGELEEKKERGLGITADMVPEFLQGQRYFNEVAETLPPGVSIGLAVTSTGGDILFIEALVTAQHGKGELVLTGSLLDVMKESAMIGRSILRSRIHTGENEKKNNDIHIHVPFGAVSKDGPSAGLAILFALYGLFKNRPIKENLAVTGEITLRGKVLPIGGVKEKLIAAERAGIDTVIIPKENEGSLVDLPPDLQKKRDAGEFVVHLVENATQALKIAFPQ